MKTRQRRVKVMISLTENEHKLLTTLAKSNNTTLSNYLITNVNKPTNEQTQN